MKKSVRSQLQKYHLESFHWALLQCGHDRDLALDVLQTAYLKVLQKGNLFAQKASFKTWLFTVIRNSALDAFKKESKLIYQAELPDHVSEVPIEEHAERRQLLTSLLKHLSEMQRNVLQLTFYHNYTLEECADILGISLGAVRSHYDRGKKRLKQIIEQKQLKDRLL